MAKMPSMTTIAWGLAFGILAVALVSRVDWIHDAAISADKGI